MYVAAVAREPSLKEGAMRRLMKIQSLHFDETLSAVTAVGSRTSAGGKLYLTEKLGNSVHAEILCTAWCKTGLISDHNHFEMFSFVYNTVSPEMN